MRWGKRIARLILIWTLVVGMIELNFILSFRMDGGARANYGEAFAREEYIRAHLDSPCALNANQPCTREQLAEYQRYTQQYFWEDVWANSWGFLLISAVGLLVVCVVFVLLSRSGNAYLQQIFR